jgi:RNA polymerase sigma-70 factor, ECF subfamily
MENNSADTTRFLELARAGDKAALNELLARYRARLRRMVELRLDRRLQARIDASDVIQDAYVDVVRRLDEYLREPKYPLFL